MEICQKWDTHPDTWDNNQTIWDICLLELQQFAGGRSGGISKRLLKFAKDNKEEFVKIVTLICQVEGYEETIQKNFIKQYSLEIENIDLVEHKNKVTFIECQVLT